MLSGVEASLFFAIGMLRRALAAISRLELAQHHRFFGGRSVIEVTGCVRKSILKRE
jgi:hypothetical protein